MFKWLANKSTPEVADTEPKRDECLGVLWHEWGEYHCGANSVVYGKKWVLFCKSCKKDGLVNHRWCN